MGGNVPEHVREERRAAVMDAQRVISRRKNEARVGRVCDVLVERPVQSGRYSGVGRSVCEAPEVDGEIRLQSARPLRAGEWVQCRITGADDYDLTGVVVEA